MLLLVPLTDVRFQSLRMVQSPRIARRLTAWLMVVMVALLAGLVLIPWQQTSRGSGRVVAYAPTERPQTVESPIYGRVVRVGEGIVEGTVVRKGDFILEIRDIDQDRASRLAQQVAAAQDKLRFAESKIETYRRQERDLDEARNMVIEAGQALVAEAERKVAAEQQGVAAANAALAQTKSNFERQKRLFEAGIRAGVDFEKDRRSYDEAVAKLRSAEEYVKAAQQYLAAKKAELEQKSREAQTKVDYARAMQQEAQGDAALARKDLAEIEGKQSQFASRVITAPRDGILLRLMVNENAEMLKEGDPLFTIVPDTQERAVELWVDGNDVPLVTPGREVRLQFEGWPAVQFAAGWPHTAVGTFGGKVVAVDATDNGMGKFRILVRPGSPNDWPEGRLLPQGVRANGWVLLNEVALGYEIWRQLNGFPAVYGAGKQSPGQYAGEEKEPKKVKLPK